MILRYGPERVTFHVNLLSCQMHTEQELQQTRAPNNGKREKDFISCEVTYSHGSFHIKLKRTQLGLTKNKNKSKYKLWDWLHFV